MSLRRQATCYGVVAPFIWHADAATYVPLVMSGRCCPHRMACRCRAPDADRVTASSLTAQLDCPISGDICTSVSYLLRHARRYRSQGNTVRLSSQIKHYCPTTAHLVSLKYMNVSLLSSLSSTLSESTSAFNFQR